MTATRFKVLNFGLAVAAAVSLSAFNAPKAYAYPPPCVEYGLSVCDPLHTRFSDAWWACYYAAFDECESWGLVSWTPPQDSQTLERRRFPTAFETYRARLLESAPADVKPA
jgi:hypothetical protein